MTLDHPLLTTWRRQLDAMDRADTTALRDCFTPDAALLHMTGYRQPLAEWVAGIERRRYVYHRLVEHSVEVLEADEGRAHIVGYVTTGVTDDGSGHAWPLRLEQDYVRTPAGWLCSASRVTLDRRR